MSTINSSGLSDTAMKDLKLAFERLRLQAEGNSVENIIGKDSFGSVLKNAVNELNHIQTTAENEKVKFELNDPSISLASVMLSSSKANIAFQMALQVRNRFIGAYKEVMSMQV